jgi:hypothetical protein
MEPAERDVRLGQRIDVGLECCIALNGASGHEMGRAGSVVIPPHGREIPGLELVVA